MKNNICGYWLQHFQMPALLLSVFIVSCHISCVQHLHFWTLSVSEGKMLSRYFVCKTQTRF